MLRRTDRPEWGTEPPDEPLACGDCRWAVDVGLRDECVCVRGVEETGRYDELRARSWDDLPCALAEWR